jgi:CBS domain containing-hemolysin-like protein
VDGDYEHVMGFVHAKDLLKHSDEDLDELPVTTELRAVLFTGANTRADKVLARMQRERKLMAVVQDADGRNLGIATVEDLLEELVGEIHDEFDETRHAAERRELAEAAQAEAAQAEAAQASRPPGNT